MIEHILDWRPFEYYTVRLQKGKLAVKVMGELEPSSSGTHLRWSMKLDSDLPRWLCRWLSRIVLAGLRMKRNFERMDQLLAHEGLLEDPMDAEKVNRAA